MDPEMIPTSDRGLSKYLDDLHLTKEGLTGKRILDLGSGTRRFAKEAEESGINVDIFSLDPLFEDPSQKIENGQEELAKSLDETNRRSITSRTIAGFGDQLPFKDNTFDLILAEYSLPAHAVSEKQIDEFFKETTRALKVGGELRFSPSVSLQNTNLTSYIDRKLKELSKHSQYKVIKDGQLTIIEKVEMLD